VAQYRLSDGAEAQLVDILHWSERRFGGAARERYAALVLAALRNVAENPRQPNVHWRRIRKTDIGVYHIAHSRDRVSPERGRVGGPRHYLVFTIGADGAVEILGFVHDRMLLRRAFRRLAQG
jgi:toxin ParE1/3/4